MFNTQLKIDGKTFKNTGKISGRRPTRYWLAFLKTYVLTYEAKKNRIGCLAGLVPVVILGSLYLSGAKEDSYIIGLFFSVFITVIVWGILSHSIKLAHVPIEAYHSLARFIISVKGDLLKDQFSMRLNASSIEKNGTLLNPKAIGLPVVRKTTFKPYQLERYKVSLTFKDGTVCTIALNQIALRIRKIKRSRSGKTKVKIKHKHKFFHVMTLKFNADDYKINAIDDSLLHTDRFDISVVTKAGFHIVKVKAKIKITLLANKLNTKDKHNSSLYTDMLTYINTNAIMIKANNTKLIQ